MIEILVFVILGVASEIVMANSWFVIPEFVPYILFGVAIVLFIRLLVNEKAIKRQFKKF